MTTLARIRAISIPDLLVKMPDWGWLALLASLLRLPTLGFESIWYDEAFTIWLAKLDLPHLFAALPGDVHPPLWYVIEWVIVRTIGSSEFAVRLPAAIFGILDVVLIWRLADLLKFDRRTKFVAGLLGVFLPGALYYSQDARMYPMLAFLVLWMAISATKGKWLFFTVAGVLAVYLHNLAPFYVVVIWLSSVGYHLRSWYVWMKFPYFDRIEKQHAAKMLAVPFLSVGIIFLAWCLWLPVAIQMAEHLKQGFWMLPLDAGGAIMPFLTMTMGWRLGDILQMHVYIASIGMTLIALVACRSWIISRAGSILLAVSFGFPILLILISVFWRAVYLPRAMLPGVFVLMIFWAYALTHISRANRIAALVVLLPMLSLGVIAHYFPATGRFDARGWTETMTDQWQSEDIIYCLSIDGYITSGYYAGGRPAAILPQATDLSQSLSVETKDAMGFHQWTFESLAKKGFKRAWLFASETSLSSRAELDELHSILAHYANNLIRSYDDGHMKIWIYLVQTGM